MAADATMARLRIEAASSLLRDAGDLAWRLPALVSGCRTPDGRDAAVGMASRELSEYLLAAQDLLDNARSDVQGA